MTFNLKKAISKLYSKNKGSTDRKVNESSKPRPAQADGKGADMKINSYPSRRSNSREGGEVTKSVRFDVSCNRNVKIVPSHDTKSSRPATTASKNNTTTSSRKPLLPPDDDAFRKPKAMTTICSSRGVNANAPTVVARPFASSSKISEPLNSPTTVASTKSKGLNKNGISSPSSTPSSISPGMQHKDLHFKPNVTCIEEPAKAVIVTSTSSSSCSSVKSLATNSSSKDQIRLPSSRGLHSKSLSYGTIYSASKGYGNTRFVGGEYLSSSKNNQVNVYLTMDKGKGKAKNNTEDSSKLSSTSSKHVFGLGGCNYGHGSIINGMKTITRVATNPESICSGKSTGVEDAAFCDLKGVMTAEHLKAAGNEEYKRGRFSEAISFYDKALDLSPNNVGCRNNKAAALASLGKVSEAVYEYLQLIARDSNYSRAHYQLGILYTRLGELDKARKHLKLSGREQSSEAMKHLRVIEEKMKKLERSIKVQDWSLVLTQSSDAVLAGADASYQVIAAKAEALFKLHRANEALETLLAAKNSEDWIKFKKTLVGASRLSLVAIQVYFYLGRFEEAVEVAEEATSIEKNVESLIWLQKAQGTADAYRAGNEYYNQGKYSQASAMYSQGLQYDPENGILLSKRAACRLKLGQWEKSVQDSNAALESCPGLREALVQRAQAHARLGEWMKAQKDYSELFKLKPDDPTVLNSLFKMQTETERRTRHQIAKS